jgi:hypothetical protein
MSPVSGPSPEEEVRARGQGKPVEIELKKTIDMPGL